MRLPQVCAARYLVDWICQCGAKAVRLILKAAPDVNVHSCFVIQIRQLGVTGECTHSSIGATPLRALPESPGAVTLTMQPCTAGGALRTRCGSYTLGSKELLTTVRGHCNRRGLRCTDVTATGQTILFERV